jgi:osmotically-inducible protein OsmY
MRNSVITAKVKTAIFNDATLKVNEINVETFKGVLQLSGFLRSQAKHRQGGPSRTRGRGREVRQE